MNADIAPSSPQRKIRIAFIKYGGLMNCGGEKHLMRLAKALDKERFDATYFWCHPGTDFPHKSHLPFRDQLEAAGVRTVEFHVGRRDLRDPILPWVDANFFEVFQEHEFDIVQALKAGNPEFPFVYIPKPVVEWNIFGGVDHSLNTVRTICNSPWLLNYWRENGGDPRKAIAMDVGIEPSATTENLRAELGIPADAVVVGLHQRADDGIFSEIPLVAFRNVAGRVNQDLRFVLLGGGERYKQQAKKLGLDVIFLPETADWARICRFLNTLDIYGHGRRDGETYGTAIAEAMLHGLPIVSHRALVGHYNAHVVTVGDGGRVCDNLDEYEDFLLRLVVDTNLRVRLGSAGKRRAEKEYILSEIVKRIESVYVEVYQNYCTPEFIGRLHRLLRSKSWWRRARTLQRRALFSVLGPLRCLYLGLPEPMLAAIRPVRRKWKAIKGW